MALDPGRREISLQGTGQIAPSRRQWRGAGGRGKTQANQCRLFHPAGVRAPPGGVISPAQGSPANWSLAMHNSACEYELNSQFGGLCFVGLVMASTTTAA